MIAVRVAMPNTTLLRRYNDLVNAADRPVAMEASEQRLVQIEQRDRAWQADVVPFDLRASQLEAVESRLAERALHVAERALHVAERALHVAAPGH